MLKLGGFSPRLQHSFIGVTSGTTGSLARDLSGLYLCSEVILHLWLTIQYWRRGFCLEMAMLNQIEAFQPEKANDIASAEKKRAILMSVCGPSAYVIIRSLLTPLSLNEVTFEEIVSKVKEHFNPAPSEIVFRLRFHKRSQRPNESITEYVAALRNLSENCNFGNTLDDMLRDRLVGGIRDEVIQRGLLGEPNLTFDLAQKMAIAAETAQRNTE
ncbi:hypothetical protein T03_16186 [Trichinella britovi]|uniref:Paraneoplastic antigen Ma-like C-terminal domain-containing protein n=1 Tax=Trichinella britovi TaxID=45882 RepID=A0A0V1CLV6_TRIBR|nr:hypothetical protein T03_10402 [Trichinella britovi]KRY50135.1 hypothetical protein T03_16186 [Trichinella britovi]